jgi:predicted urease superfamily metal-dependent hydrolase
LKDQKLADVLAEFTRAKERPVSNTFWEANLEVMKAASNLAEEVLTSLVLIHDARRSLAR